MAKPKLTPTDLRALDHYAGIVQKYDFTGCRWYPNRRTAGKLLQLGLIETYIDERGRNYRLTSSGVEAQAAPRG